MLGMRLRTALEPHTVHTRSRCLMLSILSEEHTTIALNTRLAEWPKSVVVVYDSCTLPSLSRLYFLVGQENI